MDEHPAIKWTMHEYDHRERSADWYWAFGIIALALIIAPILLNNILLALIVLIGAIAIVLYTLKAPPLTTFEVSERGLIVAKRLYPWISLQSFAFSEHPTTKIYFQSKKKLMPPIVVPFEPHDYHYLHDFLVDFLEEAEHEENLTEHVLYYLGF